MTTLSDLDCVALTIWGEARNQPVEGKIGVAHVIRNRYLSRRWGESYPGVVFRRGQFSCWRPEGGAENYAALQALVDQVRQGHMPDDPVLRECYWIAQGVLGGQCRDNVEGATHYYASGILAPRWTHGHTPVRELGAHRFYVGIA